MVYDAPGVIVPVTIPENPWNLGKVIVAIPADDATDEIVNPGIFNGCIDCVEPIYHISGPTFNPDALCCIFVIVWGLVILFE